MGRREITYHSGERVFFHFNDLEEYHSGFWRIVHGQQKNTFVAKSHCLLTDIPEFKNAMLSVLDEWANSCEHNLTASNTNRLAWLGQAACCVAVGSPEECTRKAWHMLTQPQKDEANAAAEDVLRKWDAANRNQAADLFAEVR